MTYLLVATLLMLPAAPPDSERLAEAGALWESCQKKDPDACYRLGALGTVRIQDATARSKATAAFEAACDGGDAAACFALGMHLDDDGGLPVDGKRAFELFGQACDAGFAPACSRVSVFYRVSVPSGEPDAPKTASALLRKACDAGFPEACHDLAQAGVVGGAVAPSEGEIPRLLERGCALGSFNACLGLKERLLPAPPFACDQCEPNPVERGDAWCIDCELAICRQEHCCPTCAVRDSYACCGEEFDAPLPHPLKTPIPDPAAVAKGTAAVRALLSPWVPRLKAVCAVGVPAACRDLEQLRAIKGLPLRDPEGR